MRRAADRQRGRYAGGESQIEEADERKKHRPVQREQGTEADRVKGTCEALRSQEKAEGVQQPCKRDGTAQPVRQ